jgi:hypothetical protein
MSEVVVSAGRVPDSPPPAQEISHVTVARNVYFPPFGDGVV